MKNSNQKKGVAAAGDVNGKVCVVTGAAGVLCASLTEDLLKHGAKVAVLDLRGDVAKKLCSALAKKGLTETLPLEANVLATHQQAPRYRPVCF